MCAQRPLPLPIALISARSGHRIVTATPGDAIHCPGPYLLNVFMAGPRLSVGLDTASLPLDACTIGSPGGMPLLPPLHRTRCTGSPATSGKPDASKLVKRACVWWWWGGCWAGSHQGQRPACHGNAQRTTNNNVFEKSVRFGPTKAVVVINPSCLKRLPPGLTQSRSCVKSWRQMQPRT